MNLGKVASRMGSNVQMAARLIIGAASLLSVSLMAAGTVFAQSSPPLQGQRQIQTQSQPPLLVPGPQATPQSTADITGTVEDETGAAIAGAKVTLASGDHAQNRVAVTDANGQFTFAAVRSGNFQLAISANGFAMKTQSLSVNAGETQTIPPITLAIATEVTQVRVGLSHDEIVEMAHEEIKEEEKQRVLGVFPNFYVTYIPDAAALTPKQKFQLAFRSTIDPVTFLVTGAAAGVEQADSQFSGFGGGAAGYGKRYGAAYADTVTSTFIGGAILPSLLKQDPRYFYKGTGSTKSRILYAIANAVICKGDNKRWQPNYSGILGGLAAAGISNLYYPSENRNGLELTFENTLIGIGTTAASNILQEFVVRKLTPNLPGNHAGKAGNTVSEILTVVIHQGR